MAESKPEIHWSVLGEAEYCTSLHSLQANSLTNRINLSLILGVNILQQETGSIRSVGPLVVNLYLRGHTFCF